MIKYKKKVTIESIVFLSVSVLSFSDQQLPAIRKFGAGSLIQSHRQIIEFCEKLERSSHKLFDIRNRTRIAYCGCLEAWLKIVSNPRTKEKTNSIELGYVR